MSFGTRRIEDPSDLYAQGTDLASRKSQSFKLNYMVTEHELEEMVSQMKTMRDGLEIQFEYRIFGAVVTCIQHMYQR
jgi:hypothetical protein